MPPRRKPAATIWALRGAKSFFQTVPGELVGPVPMLLTSLACLSVFCFTSGALFVAAARMAESESGLTPRAAASTAYLVEAAGSALGGILASIVFVRFCNAFQIAVIVGRSTFAWPRRSSFACAAHRLRYWLRRRFWPRFRCSFGSPRSGMRPPALASGAAFTSSPHATPSTATSP